MLKESLTEEIKSHKPHALFLDLGRYLGEVSPGTVPVGIALAFCAAIDDWLEGGGSYGRRSTYLRRRGFIVDSLTEKGYQPLIPIEESSCSLTVWRVPAGFTSSKWLLHNEMNGYALFPCKGELAEDWYQVSVMGAIPNGAIHDWTKLVPKATS